MKFSIRQLLLFIAVLSVALVLPKLGAWVGILVPLFVGSIVWGTLSGRRRHSFAWGGLIGIVVALTVASIYALVVDFESDNRKVGKPLEFRPNPIGEYCVPVGLVVGGAIGLLVTPKPSVPQLGKTRRS